MNNIGSPKDTNEITAQEPQEVTAGRLLVATAHRLAEAGISSAVAEARTLITQVVTGEIILAPPPDAAARANLEELIVARLQGQPLQHVVGKMPFFGLELISDPRALIARPETELVAEVAIAELRSRPKSERLAIDLGTGSGALALALAVNVAQLQVVAVDIAPPALELAAENYQRYASAITGHGSSVSFIAADLREVERGTLAAQLRGQGSSDLAASVLTGSYVVVANPPYLPDTEALGSDLSYDPAGALFGGGTDGMALPRATLAAASRLLVSGGRALIEHHDSQGAAMREAAREFGLTRAKTCRDLVGRERFLSARAVGKFPAATKSGKIEP